jgi:hypothetical protein
MLISCRAAKEKGDVLDKSQLSFSITQMQIKPKFTSFIGENRFFSVVCRTLVERAQILWNMHKNSPLGE